MVAGHQTHAGRPGQGLPFEKVKIEEVLFEEGYAVCLNEFGKPRQVPLHPRAKGMRPVQGETWIISRDLGYWTFAMCVGWSPPIITGTTDGNPALEDLLTKLDEAGVIVDNTTSTRIRATHEHTHVAPDGGGTTTTETPL
jgi:hypothetical protein